MTGVQTCALPICLRLMAKPFWDKPSPKKKSKPLTASQKASAKKRAKAAGRPYPNLVDNAFAGKKKF